MLKNNYISQVVKVSSIQKKSFMNVCSKILLQINSKFGDISYKKQDKSINDRKIMVIGVNSIHLKDKETGVAMVATLDDNFTNFFNKELIIKEENNKEKLQYYISSFIKKSIEVYKKENKELPKNIIIYRHGVSLKQEEFLKAEITQIDFSCKINNILYYYIIVNTRNNFAFFEYANNRFSNPEPTLLIIDDIANRNFFKFYIQPQEITQGTVTPICFHVAYGNLNCPEFIPKFTYDLCKIYSNWQGTISIPNVLKIAEKLSKMIIKYNILELNESLEIGQAYL